MDPHEAFLKHWFEIPAACIAALATVGAAIYAVRAYKAQAKQLKELEEDRLFAGLEKSPRFMVDHYCEIMEHRGGQWVRAYPRLMTPEPQFNLVPISLFYESSFPIWFQVSNQRRDVRIKQLHVTDVNGKPSPVSLIQNASESPQYLVSYPEALAEKKTRIRLKIYFETTDGFEGVHTYETICGEMDFRRVHPPSIIDNAGIQFGDR